MPQFSSIAARAAYLLWVLSWRPLGLDTPAQSLHLFAAATGSSSNSGSVLPPSMDALAGQDALDAVVEGHKSGSAFDAINHTTLQRAVSTGLGPSIMILHPREGSVVTSGSSALIAPDAADFDRNLHEICWRFGNDDESDVSVGATCVADSGMRIMTAVGGPLQLSVFLVKREGVGSGGGGGVPWNGRVLAKHTVRFTAIPGGAASPCNASNWWSLTAPATSPEVGPCGLGIVPHCTRFTRFRFFLYDMGWDHAAADAASASNTSRPFSKDYKRLFPLSTANLSSLAPNSLDSMLVDPPSTQALEVYRVLRDSPLRTQDPKDACIKVALSDMQAANVAAELDVLSAARVSLLPTWNSGAGHMVFSFGDHGLRYDTAKAIVAGSGLWPAGTPPYEWPTAWIASHNGGRMPAPPAVVRDGMDIVLPLPFYRCGWPADMHLKRFAGIHIPLSADRTLLLAFKGSVYSFPGDHPAASRQALRRVLHNGPGGDISIQLTCWNSAPSCEPCMAQSCDPANPPLTQHYTASVRDFPECPTWTSEAEQPDHEFGALLLSSRFAAVIPGEGPHSYRLAEALAAGSIPVFFPGAVRPLEPFIEWSHCALWIDGAGVPSDDTLRFVEKALRDIPLERVTSMQASCRAIFSSAFADLDTSVHAGFALLAQRYAAAEKTVLAAQDARKKLQAENASEGVSPGPGPAVEVDPAGPIVPPSPLPNADPLKPSPRLRALVSTLLQGEGQGHGLVARFQPLLDYAASCYNRTLPLGLPMLQGISVAARETSLELERTLRTAAADEAVRLQLPPGNILTATAEAMERQLSAHAAGILAPAMRNVTHGPTALSLAAHIHEAVDAYLLYLRLGTPTLPDRLHEDGRAGIAEALGTLSRMYSLLGHSRQAATAAQCVHVVTGPERAGGRDQEDALAVQTSVVDCRASPTTDDGNALLNSPFAPITISQLPTFSLARLTASSRSMLDRSLFGGIGILAHFTGSAPLSSVGGPAIPLPVATRGSRQPFLGGDGAAPAITLADIDSPMPYVLLSELLARVVAARLAGEPGFRLGGGASLAAFRKDARLPPVLPGAYGSLAIVSLCAYPPNTTVLPSISTENLRQYCAGTEKKMGSRGYDCFIGTQATDPGRPFAWSKLPLAAHFLPSYSWVMWKDCDTFMVPSAGPQGASWTPVEEVLQASAYARAVIARTVAGVLENVNLLEAVSAGGAGMTGAQCGHAVPIGSAPLSVVWGEDGFMLNTGVWLARGGRAMGETQSPVDMHTAGFGLRLLRRAYGECYRQGGGGRDLSLSVHALAGAGSAQGPSTPLPGHTTLGLPPSPAYLSSSTTTAMLDPLLRDSIHSLVTNRLWEQGTLLAQVALDDAIITGANAGAVPGGAKGGWFTPAAESAPPVCGLPSPLGSHVPGYAIHAHTAWMPQKWFNTYPPVISGVLTNDRGVPLHAAWARGDAAISFSGCTAYFKASDCEGLFRAAADEIAAILAEK